MLCANFRTIEMCLNLVRGKKNTIEDEVDETM